MLQATFTCAICGAVAARAELEPSDEAATEGEDAGRGAGTLRLSGFVWPSDPVVDRLTPARYAAYAEALSEGSAPAFFRADMTAPDREPATFYCYQCERCYCERHWHDVMPEFDEGYYDATYGLCPLGHRRKMED